jgi:hypothetical protein
MIMRPVVRKLADLYEKMVFERLDSTPFASLTELQRAAVDVYRAATAAHSSAIRSR